MAFRQRFFAASLGGWRIAAAATGLWCATPIGFAQAQYAQAESVPARIETITTERPSRAFNLRRALGEPEMLGFGALALGLGLGAGFLLASIASHRSVEESRTRFQTWLRVMSCLAFESDQAGANTFVSDQWRAYTGMSAQEAAGDGWIRAVHRDDVPAWDQRWAVAVTKPAPIELRCRLRAASGHHRWFALRAQPMRDKRGAVVGFLGGFTDIDEFIRVDEALASSEARLRAVFATAPVGLYLIDREMRFLQVNERMAEMTGLPAGDHVGRGLAEILPCLAEAVAPILSSVMISAETARDVEIRGGTVSDPSKARIWLTSFAPVRGPDGTIVAVSASALEVTERERAREAIRLSEERLRLAAAMAGIGTVDLDLATDRAVVSSEVRAIYGFSPDQPIKGAMFRQVIHPDDRGALLAARAALLDPAGTGEFAEQFRITCANGGIRWIHARGRAFFQTRDGARQAVRVIGVMRDITEERARVEMLAEINAELERRVEERTAQLVQTQKMEAIGQLTSGVAHDFNNVLQGVGSCLAAMEASMADQRSHPLFEAARQGLERGARLTQHLLAFARRQKLSPKPIDIATMLNALEPILARSMGGLIRVGVEVAGDCWPALVDPTQIELAILNLAINARDAMPLGGRLVFRAANAVIAEDGHPRPHGLKDGDYVAIAVSDTGTGMEPATLAHVFEPFFTTKESGKGSGLGLAMVHGMAVQSGGGVHIASEPGQGTVVTIYLPRTKATVAVAERPAPAPAPAPVSRAATAGSVVLLVEDDALVRLGAVTLVESLGYRVVPADGGPAALKLLRDGLTADALITDYAMPGMSGTVLVEEARRILPGLPALLMTGYAERPVDALDIMFLQKPFRPAELASRLAALLPTPPMERTRVAPLFGRRA